MSNAEETPSSSKSDPAAAASQENAATEELPKKAAIKKAVKKRNTGARSNAKKATAKKSETDVKAVQDEASVPTHFSTSDEDMIEQNSSHSEVNEDTENSPAGNKEPANEKVNQSSEAEDGSRPQKNFRQDQRNGGNRHRNDRQNRNNKFNKKAKKKTRWQKNRNKGPREEASSLNLGELSEFELFSDKEAVEKLAGELASGQSEALDFNRIYEFPLPELRAEAETLSVPLPSAPNREQLVNAFLQHAADEKRAIETEGVLEILEDEEGGVIAYQCDSYRLRGLSAYVPRFFIERYGLQQGHIVRAQLHPRRESESCPFVLKILSVMGRDPESLNEIVPFTERVPYYPTSRILLETSAESDWDNLSMRVVDCLTPIGLGQRGLIVAPPRTGKTVLLQSMANAIQQSYPEAHLIVLLIDERPEEVTDFRRQCTGEVISSTFDESAESHVHAAEMVIEKARRMVEVGQDVVILLDSITRLARAYNTMMPNSGKILSGGVEANALQRPKRFFGSARNIEDGGSLTILGTALVETGSKMDEVIFEEFKGTGNMELHLDRGLSDKRIFPALNMEKSGTRKEELLYHTDEMQKIYSLRRAMKGIPSVDAMEMLIQRIKKTGSNAEFLMSVAK